jgi:hypothetical protein
MRSPIYVTILSGNNLFSIFSKNGIVQKNTSTPSILNIIWAFATVLSTDAP